MLVLRQPTRVHSPVPYLTKSTCAIHFSEDASELNACIDAMRTKCDDKSGAILCHEGRDGQRLLVRAMVDIPRFCSLVNGSLSWISIVPPLSRDEWVRLENDWRFQVDVNHNTRVVRTDNDIDVIIDYLANTNSCLATTYRFDDDMMYIAICGNKAVASHIPAAGKVSRFTPSRRPVPGIVKFYNEELNEDTDVEACFVISRAEALDTLSRYLRSIDASEWQAPDVG